MTLTHLDLDRIDGLAGRLRESKAEVLRLLAKDAGSLKAASVISGWIWDTDSALADLTALITRIRELEEALEPFVKMAEGEPDTIMLRTDGPWFRRARTALQRKTS